MGAVCFDRTCDQGLYLPDSATHTRIAWTPNFVEFAARMLLAFAGESLGKAEALSIARRAFTFPVHWRELSPKRYQLELFHGPTGSCKDFGSQLLVQLLAATPCKKQRLVMLASYSDSAPAIAAAFSKQPEIQVIILYPKYEVPVTFQEELGSWGNHIQIFGVSGGLQQCQDMIDECAREPVIQENFTVTTVDDANIVWLLAQIISCSYGSLLSETLHRQPLNVIIPSGNAGYLVAACLVREMGYPVDEIIAAQSSNCPIVDYVTTGYMPKREPLHSIIPGMNVTQPANWPRLQALFPSWEDFIDHVQAYSASDEQVKDAIRECYVKHEMILSPQTALAYAGIPSLDADSRPWGITAVTNPAKYPSLIESVIQKLPVVAMSLKRQQLKPDSVIELSPEIDKLSTIILDLSAELEIAC
jgi:threonine synthase